MKSFEQKESGLQYIGVQQTGVNQQSNVVSVKLSLNATIVKDDETGIYVVTCQALELSTQGDSIEEAEKNIAEAVDLFLEACIEDNMLGEVLTDCGFYEVAKGKPKRNRKGRKMPSMQNADVLRQITVPVELPVMMHDCR